VETAADYALTFDGNRQYATTATSNFPLAKIDQSITVWIKPGPSTLDQVVFTMRRDIESGTQLGFSDGRVTVWSVWGNRIFVQSPEALAADRWYHIAYVQTVIDADEPAYQQHLFVNGEIAAEGTLPPQSRTPTSSWLGSFDGVSLHYIGSMDDLSLYSRALSDSEIANEADGTALPSRDSLVALWNFNESPGGQVAYDRSGYDNHASLGDGIATLMPLRTAH
jgi:hypothetical protein